MNSVSIKLDKAAFDNVLKVLDPKQQNIIIQRVTNELARDARARARSEIHKRYNIKLNEVDISVQKANSNNLTAYLRAPLKKISMSRFGARQSKAAVTAMIIRGKRVVIRNAFMATPSGIDYSHRGQSKRMISAIRTVFARTGKKAYPIKHVRTLSIRQMVRSRHITVKIQEMVNQKSGSLLQGHINYLLFGKRKT